MLKQEKEKREKSKSEIITLKSKIDQLMKNESGLTTTTSTTSNNKYKQISQVIMQHYSK